jgi:hypothetical protein
MKPFCTTATWVDEKQDAGGVKRVVRLCGDVVVAVVVAVAVAIIFGD